MFLDHRVDILIDKNLKFNQKSKFQSFLIKKLINVYSILSSYRFYYKAHPNEVIEKEDFGLEIYKNNSPWELTINSMKDSCILISVFSTASLTPKTLYNKEPRLVFLFRLFEPYVFFQAEEFLVRVKNSYKHKDRVIAPRTINELFEVLSKFSKGC